MYEQEHDRAKPTARTKRDRGTALAPLETALGLLRHFPRQRFPRTRHRRRFLPRHQMAQRLPSETSSTWLCGYFDTERRRGLPTRRQDGTA